MTMNVTGGREGQWSYFGIAAAIVGAVATWLIQFTVSPDDMDAGGQVFFDAVGEDPNEVIHRLACGLGLIAAALLVVFAVGWKRALAERTPDSDAPRLIELSMVVTAAALFVGFICVGMVFDSRGYYGIEPNNTIWVFASDVPLAAWGGLGLAAAAAVTLSFGESAVLPRWFGIVSVIAVALHVLLALSGTPFPMNFPGLIWLLLAGIVAGKPAANAR